MADVGSGSGCIGLTLAAERPLLRLYAIDKAEAPLAFTRENVEALGLKDRVAVLRGSLLAPVPSTRRIDWGVSNPPYIPSADLEGLAPKVRVRSRGWRWMAGPTGSTCTGRSSTRRRAHSAAWRLRWGTGRRRRWPRSWRRRGSPGSRCTPTSGRCSGW